MPPTRTSPRSLRSRGDTTPISTSSRANHKEKVCEANRTYQSDDADFTLISSDGLSFKVHTYQLMATSSVFRSMLCIKSVNSSSSSSESDRILELSDSSTEDAEGIRAFLDCIYGIKTEIRTKDLHTNVKLIHLLKKYDCETTIRNFELFLESHIHNSIGSVSTIFILAAHLNNIGICGKALERGNRAWSRGSSGKFNENIEGSSVFDLSSMNLDHLNLIPVRYISGLLRATREERPTDLKQANWDKISEVFKRLMKENE